MFVLRQQVGRCFTVSHRAEHKALNHLVPHRNRFLPPVRTFCSTHSRGRQLPTMHHIKTNLDLSHYRPLLPNHGYTLTPFDRSLRSIRKQNVTGFIRSKGKGGRFLQDIVAFDTSAQLDFYHWLSQGNVIWQHAVEGRVAQILIVDTSSLVFQGKINPNRADKYFDTFLGQF